GGDYFDIIRLSSKTVGIAIGDICGHGVPAALLSSTVQAAIRSQLEYTLSPAQVMQHLNRFLMESTAESVFVTLFLGILECKSGVLTYINAGHPPPVHISRERTVKELRAGAAALGIVEQDFRCEQEARVLAGDMLLLYTDGVIESQNKQREIYGRKRLLDVVRGGCLNRKGRKPKLSELSGRIKQDVLAFMAGAKQTDDLTLVELARR
ncbi:MAG: serine/threonine-protein phosphatase, partial [Calditrichaeota bacterium]